MHPIEIVLRPATFADWEQLLAWRNDPVTRQSSHNVEPVREEVHRNWLKSVLENPDRKLFIALEGDEAVGTCRADLHGDVYELSWTIAPAARGRGIGKRMVQALAQQMGGRLRAEVLAGNPASGRIAEAAGLAFKEQVGDILHYANF
ncbi:MAG: GNAT family N-acetyltransferase [Bacteroidia bacterium]|nr:GNAT family N-acetyltransferase [Bacteroidia bacterium]